MVLKAIPKDLIPDNINTKLSITNEMRVIREVLGVTILSYFTFVSYNIDGM